MTLDFRDWPLVLAKPSPAMRNNSLPMWIFDDFYNRPEMPVLFFYSFLHPKLAATVAP